jgi:hypothetical protein
VVKSSKVRQRAGSGRDGKPSATRGESAGGESTHGGGQERPKEKDSEVQWCAVEGGDSFCRSAKRNHSLLIIQHTLC